MIFHLDCSINELETANANEMEETIARLVDADRSGKHFFVLKRELCGWAIDNLELSRLDKEHLITIREDYAGRGGLPRLAKAVIKVRIGSDAVSFDGDGIFSVGHVELIQGEYLSSSAVFVMEDVAADGRLYSHIFGEVRKISAVPSYRFDPVHGGGSVTETVLNNEIRKKRIVVCVVDHDKVAPMDRKSSTAKGILTNHHRRNVGQSYKHECYVGVSCTTIGKELENWIPYHLFKLMPRFRNHSSFGKLDEVMGDLSEEDGHCFWLHFDIKEGIDGKKLRKKLDDGEVSADVIEWVCAKIGSSGSALEEVRIDGFGLGIIDAFFGSQEAIKGFHSFVRSEHWRRLFGGYFEDLLWYFAAPLRNRT